MLWCPPSLSGPERFVLHPLGVLLAVSPLQKSFSAEDSHFAQGYALPLKAAHIHAWT